MPLKGFVLNLMSINHWNITDGEAVIQRIVMHIRFVMHIG